jgi:hypothetical protein
VGGRLDNLSRFNNFFLVGDQCMSDETIYEKPKDPGFAPLPWATFRYQKFFSLRLLSFCTAVYKLFMMLKTELLRLAGLYLTAKS